MYVHSKNVSHYCQLPMREQTNAHVTRAACKHCTARQARCTDLPASVVSDALVSSDSDKPLAVQVLQYTFVPTLTLTAGLRDKFRVLCISILTWAGLTMSNNGGRTSVTYVCGELDCRREFGLHGIVRSGGGVFSDDVLQLNIVGRYCIEMTLSYLP